MLMSPDGKHLVVALPSQGIMIWNVLEKKRLLHVFDDANFVCFSDCGRMLATVSQKTNTITLRQVSENEKWESLTILLEDQDSRITCIDFYTTDLLLVGFANGDVSLLDAKAKTVLCTSRLHKKGPVRFAIRTIEMEILSVGADRRLVRSKVVYPEYAQPFLKICSRRRKADTEMTDYVGIGRGRNSALILATSYGRVEYRCDLHRRKADILHMGWRRSAPVLISGAPDMCHLPEYREATAFSASYHSSKEQIYLGFCNGGISIGSLRLRQTILTKRRKAELISLEEFVAHDEAVTAMAGSTKTNILASASTDGQVKLWDLTTLSFIATLP